MEEKVLASVRKALTEAAEKGSGAIWAAYRMLLKEGGTDWQVLAAISVVSAELFWASVKQDNNEYISIFCAMNVIVDDYARDHSEEMDNYPAFREHFREWNSEIPF